MKVRIRVRWPLWSRESRCAALSPVARLIEAARQTRFYSATPIAPILRSAQQHWAALPAISVDEFLEGRPYFQNPSAEKSRPGRLCYPLAATPRTAVLEGGYASGPHLRVMATDWRTALTQYRPEAIAATLRQLRELAWLVQRREVRLSPRLRALIALARPGDEVLSSRDRDSLWSAFRVPLFQQLIGFEGELLASECEAHDGLHVVAENAVMEVLHGRLLVTSLQNLRTPVLRLDTGLAARLESHQCECGRSGSRVTLLPPARSVPVRRAAHAAAG